MMRCAHARSSERALRPTNVTESVRYRDKCRQIAAELCRLSVLYRYHYHHRDVIVIQCGTVTQFQILRMESQEPVATAAPSSVTPRQLTRLSCPASTPTHQQWSVYRR